MLLACDSCHCARHDLGEESHQQAHDPGDAHHHDHQGKRRLHQRDVGEQFQSQGPDAGTESEREAREADAAEDVDRLLGVPVEEGHDDQVEDDLHDALEAILRGAEAARVVAHRDLGHPRAVPRRIDRHEAVHLAVELHVLDHLAAVGLERATVVVQGNAGHERDQAIGDAAGKVAAQRVVLPVLAPARAHVEALVQLGEQQRDVLRVVLEVGVDRDDHLARGEVDARHHRGGLPAVAAEVDHLDARLFARQGIEHGIAAVAAAVVHEDDFPGAPEALEHGGERRHQRGQALALVEHRDRDRDHRRGGGSGPAFGGRSGRGARLSGPESGRHSGGRSARS
jgi:hypothetical protein